MKNKRKKSTSTTTEMVEVEPTAVMMNISSSSSSSESEMARALFGVVWGVEGDEMSKESFEEFSPLPFFFFFLKKVDMSKESERE